MRKFTSPPIEIGKSTHTGMRRSENQDSLDYVLLEKLPYDGAHLLVVADGMGGASGGQIASSIAVQEVMKYFRRDNPNMEPDVALREAIECGAAAVAKRTQEDPHLEGMGTTCVSILVHNGYLFAGHIGDSRLYLLREGTLHRLSRDHSAVQRLVEAGILTEDEARNHPRQNVLARVLGSDQPPLVEILAPPWKLKQGDRIMLCSDGLHGEVSDTTIASVLGQLPAQEAADKLIELANAAGGNDNITVEVLAYGPIKPPVHTETWYAFTNATTNYLLYGVLVVFFYTWGYLAGRSEQQLYVPKPTQPSSRAIPGISPSAHLPPDVRPPCIEEAKKKGKCKPPWQKDTPPTVRQPPITRPLRKSTQGILSRPAPSGGRIPAPLSRVKFSTRIPPAPGARRAMGLSRHIANRSTSRPHATVPPTSRPAKPNIAIRRPRGG